MDRYDRGDRLDRGKGCGEHGRAAVLFMRASFPLDVYPGVKLLDYTVDLFSVF